MHLPTGIFSIVKVREPAAIFSAAALTSVRRVYNQIYDVLPIGQKMYKVAAAGNENRECYRVIIITAVPAVAS